MCIRADHWLISDAHSRNTTEWHFLRRVCGWRSAKLSDLASVGDSTGAGLFHAVVLVESHRLSVNIQGYVVN